MIDFNFETARFHVTEANAPKYRALLDSGKPRKFSKGSDASLKRYYPTFKPGMSTADYVAQFVSLNYKGLNLARLDHECPNYHEPAPMLDPTFPEVTEEIDPDYVEPVKARKPRNTLAAAAPDLLEAAEYVVALLSSDFPNGNIALDKCRAAIAKAKG